METAGPGAHHLLLEAVPETYLGSLSCVISLGLLLIWNIQFHHRDGITARPR